MIKLSIPHIGGKEKEYVSDAIDSTWIVPLGPYVDRFEEMLEAYLEADNIVALSAGTAAIHLGLIMAGVKRGDEVICQSLTFSASCNPIIYIGATPILIDSEPDTWNMSPTYLEDAIIDRRDKTGKYPAAIVVVHLYGMPAKMNEIMAIADKYGIPVVEDAAEALGSTYYGKKCGTIGKYGVLSFNGNKIITTSGGGALICPDKESDKRVKFLSTQARENRPYYYHTTIGYNYRLSNVSAAIGCAQMEVLPDRVRRRKEIHDLYAEGLSQISGISVLSNPADGFNSNFWLTTILLDPNFVAITPDELRERLLSRGIETRLIWRPMHMQPIYAEMPFYGSKCSEDIFSRGLCLPSGSVLENDDISFVIENIKECV